MGGEPPSWSIDFRSQILPYAQTTFTSPLDDLPEIVRHALLVYENVPGVSPTDALYLLKEAEERPENLRALETENDRLRTEVTETIQTLREAQAEGARTKDELKLTKRQLEDSRERFRRADGQRDLLTTAANRLMALGPLRGSKTALSILEQLRQKDEDLYESILNADSE